MAAGALIGLLRELRDNMGHLFVFCFDGGDGVFTAHEALVGQDVRTLRDKTGKAYGEEMYRRAKEGQITEIAYMSSIPGKFFQAAKRAYIARVADQVCGVSFYRFNGPGTPVEYTPVK
jgi:signal transduction histidine kinase